MSKNYAQDLHQADPNSGTASWKSWSLCGTQKRERTFQNKRICIATGSVFSLQNIEYWRMPQSVHKDDVYCLADTS